MRVSVFDELADEIRGIAREQAVNAVKPPRRFKVRRLDPLLLEEVNGDLVLEDGDPDFEIDERLKPGAHTTCPAGTGHRNEGSLPQLGDIVIVEQDRHGDYVARGLVKGG